MTTYPTDRCLTPDEIAEALATLPGWTYAADQRAIERKMEFESFIAAFSVMTQMAIYAEKLNHHPEMYNVYNRLDIRLTTHDLGGISGRDVALAELINQAVSS
jgi:4a-hydroxytetrahydrobiopterin dehydratase